MNILNFIGLIINFVGEFLDKNVISIFKKFWIG
jgi:hypothetical protein